ncbi:MAG TPA: RNA polymerase sigma factor [Polyangia bacterium]|jgi:RNA polymerase sigma-70 factor (ECF subfamily)|nr:RNA polymerase sigma factor [Polyangia bacterium]
MDQLTSHKGTRDGFCEAILPVQPTLLRVALGLTRDPSEAHDLVQDALERALREWERFTPGTNVRAWATTILSRLFIDRWRQRRRQPKFVGLEAIETPTHAADPKADDAPPAPWETVTEADLTWAVSQLPQDLRVVFELNVNGGLSYLQISEAASIPVNTVGTRLLRARKHLRARLCERLTSREAPAAPQLPFPASPAAVQFATL